VADQKSERSEAFLGMFAEALLEQEPTFLSVRITESENVGPDFDARNPEPTLTDSRKRESAGSQDSLLASGVYTTAILQLGALTPEVSLTDLEMALDLANRAWWRLQEARSPPQESGGCRASPHLP
jgi:hypothetical protein